MKTTLSECQHIKDGGGVGVKADCLKKDLGLIKDGKKLKKHNVKNYN